MVYFGNLSPFDDALREMGAPWWRNDKWDPLITWWEIRGHNAGPLMTQWWIGTLDNVMGNKRLPFYWHDEEIGALDGAVENLGPFALWWCNEAIENNKAMGKLES